MPSDPASASKRENLTVRLYAEALETVGTTHPVVRELLMHQQATISRIVDKTRQLKVSKLHSIIRRIGQFRRLFMHKRVLFQ